jgi:hypothetical protein
VVPGVMPTTNFAGIARMAAKAGASIPAWLAKAYDGLEEDVETRRIVAAGRTGPIRCSSCCVAWVSASSTSTRSTRRT